MIPEGVKVEFLTSCRVVKDQFVFVVINETSRWRRLFEHHFLCMSPLSLVARTKT